MAKQFTITYEEQLLSVSRAEGEHYYQLLFPDGKTKLIEDSSHGWKYVVPSVTNQEEIENELLDEESSLELSEELEAEAIGKLIYEKERDMGLK
jgi:hypothetical protein